MPNIDNKNQNKKGLGRGLGSLLTMDASDFEESKNSAPSPKKPQERVSQQSSSTPMENKKTTNIVSVNTSTSNDLADMTRVLSLAIEKIIPNKTQPRKDFNKEPLSELAQSIKEHGVLQPITVRKKGEQYEIIAGERRWRASQLAGLKIIPAIVKNVDDQKSMELALIENLQREDLNAVEEALGYQLLIDEYSLSQQELSEKIGKSRSSITNTLRILALPLEIKGYIREGILSLGHAKVLLGLNDGALQTKLAKKAIAKKLSVRGLEKEITKFQSGNNENIGTLDVSERLTQGLAIDLQKILGTKVNIAYKKGKGRIEISFYSDDQLSQFSEKIKRVWGK